MSSRTKRFAAVEPDGSPDVREKEILRFWEAADVYRRSLAPEESSGRFVFYEGPPTANGAPHPGHCLGRTVKDIFPRYHAMTGQVVERRGGWDTHGLPVEVEVAKELGILDGGKEAIEAYGVANFNRACLGSVFRYRTEWEDLTRRIGFWIDLEAAYATYRKTYVESVWWALKMLFERGLLYRGRKVVWWWAQGGTALSAGEVAEGYRDVQDPSIVLRFPLHADDQARLGLDRPASLLVWTTTPWTLPSNCAACVRPGERYVAAAPAGNTDDCLIVAESRLTEVLGADAIPLKHFTAAELEGSRYLPCFTSGDAGAAEGRWRVVADDFVEMDSGTGIVHLAPAFGEDDYRICGSGQVPFVCVLNPDGTFPEDFGERDPKSGESLAGSFCKDADSALIRLLKERGLLFSQSTLQHSYPFCPRAPSDPLIQFARESWFIGTSGLRDEFLANNARIEWKPSHVRDGRFGDFLRGNVDWAISRERYWGTPLPVWVCEQTGETECLGSMAELLAKPGLEGAEEWAALKKEQPDLDDDLQIHRPYIDAITYRSPADPEARMRRVPEIVDVWFDSGCMPFAQWGYPHVPGSESLFSERFPADFSSEGLDQTRGWFYSLLAVSTMLFPDRDVPHPFRSCVCTGMVLGDDGLKLSKRLKNYRDPFELFERYGADAVRWSLVSKSDPTSSGRLDEKQVSEAQREFLNRWLNVLNFFVEYANLDGFDPEAGELASPRPVAERSLLDRWILAELADTIRRIRTALDGLELLDATRRVLHFVDSLSNWYVRRSRQRFWSHGASDDKADAYHTLYACLDALSRLAAPFVPFTAEYSWRVLQGAGEGDDRSVHLTRYPRPDEFPSDSALCEEMAAVRRAVSLGLSARKQAKIKVRQPLAEARVVISDVAERERIQRHADLIAGELNVKRVSTPHELDQYADFEVKPNFRKLGKRLGPKMKVLARVLSESDGGTWLRKIEEGGIPVELEGERILLGADEIEVRILPKEGFSAAGDTKMLVAIATEVDEELRLEGLAREMIRAAQQVRKDLGLAYSDRVSLGIRTEEPRLRAAAERHRDLIGREVLAQVVNVEEAAAQQPAIQLEEGSFSVSIVPLPAAE